MKKSLRDKKIIIVGAGFGGVRCALDLIAQKPPKTRIILISDKPHFEYNPTLYRAVTGRSPLEVCIPLEEIFKNKEIEVLEDFITEFDLKEKILKGKSGSRYSFDFLVLAMGSETAYFDIPGLKELSFGFKSIREALLLKKHFHELFTFYEKADLEEKVKAAHIVIVGGGATGVELAGELAVYTKRMAKNHNLDPSLITIDIIEAASRLLPALLKNISEKVESRLRELGVNVFLNRKVVKEEVEEVFLKDMELKTKTVIWTAGTRPNYLYTQIKGLDFDQNGRVKVNEFLEAEEFNDIFIIGDAAATTYSGMAQTAIHNGRYAAKIISRKIRSQSFFPYKDKKPAYAIPVGPSWAAVLIGPLRFYGRFGWLVRRLADLRYFLSILSFKKALLAFRTGKILWESCPICFND
ncbi:MAG: hypothetical protein A3A94_01550 [Candidatus Portnoybacteria bacterium RIFCSPLOWO2_01_FULL_43_11]|uniref:FAD/NAD(P)-binding domain-containing protein n=4 Tax=Candidatus Portnoyibacteriota TaxID=1817913 RepID=A0A1G2FCS8_9BACT|nr:MAG: hypothetical protein A2815_00295 [Candidatus Portnoybacteria bacterium RIFCSPHIGHO2_01_FULL_40_12b]OGZ37784.1 MAG: hypothetical protein A3E90_02070 [Candidatus Portnoybacteria bacterium RIFCSPHIGHO2_12_FULL_40_11]OGZ39152.1 MAG: hypothetical protein A3A94_01550 [Candidatus Portnoybacteria bacterium RIFCSPLOWO2_01_FULL_43_11]OGZ39882.1 MAG: hypothetical protein A3I20_02705 [Candidatus Portnoybacteria bacterium RIFCSPLOWO2_02_FULL_40_15]